MPPLCSPLLCARVARPLLRSAYAQLTLYSPASVIERMWRVGEGWRAGGVGGGGAGGCWVPDRPLWNSKTTRALRPHRCATPLPPTHPPLTDGQLSNLQTDTHLSNAAQGSRTGGGTFSVVSQSGRGNRHNLKLPRAPGPCPKLSDSHGGQARRTRATLAARECSRMILFIVRSVGGRRVPCARTARSRRRRV